MGMTDATRTLVNALPAAPGTGSDDTLVNHASHHESLHAAMKEVYSPRRYVALVNQVGTGDPSATVLENSMAGAVTWSRLSEGNFRCSCADIVTAKTAVFASGYSSSADAVYWLQVMPTATGVIDFRFMDGSADYHDTVFFSVMILVYP